jgi:hypothetical protein
MAHSSLGAPTLVVPRLNAQRTMRRNERCWCGSNKKWKHCHKDREDQTPGPILQHVHELREKLREGRCVHPDAGSGACSGEAISAHTIQRNGGLSAIAELGHVISIKTAFEDLHKNSGAFIPRLVGVRSASTFRGFCNLHDTTMFSPVEAGEKRLNSENCFLLSFRALAYELVIKQAAIDSLPLLRDNDKGRPFEEQVAIQEQLNALEAGYRLSLDYLERWKLRYDAIYLSRDFRAHKTRAVAFDGILPVAACGAFMPEFDFEGRHLQKLDVGPANQEQVTFNLTVFDGRSVAVLGWVGEQGGPAAEFAGSFAEAAKVNGADAAARLAFEYVENTYMRPSWWEGLPLAPRSKAISHMHSGTPFGPRRTSKNVAEKQSTFDFKVDAVEFFEH